MEDRHPVRQMMMLIAAAGLMMWLEMPDWQRRALIARVRLRVKRTAAWMAYRSGHRAMGDELAGHDDAADAGYGVAYRLSLLRDRL